jgi:Flp pilus assembly protein TadG
MTVGLIFLLIVVIALFEMAMIFYSYISLLNAAREGAVYASLYPDVATGASSPHYSEYERRASLEATAAGLITSTGLFTVHTPLLETSCTPPVPCHITCTLQYELINATQGIFLPMLGRMGLLSRFAIRARVEMPIR